MKNELSPQLKASLIRGILGAVVVGSFAAITWLASKPEYAVFAAIIGQMFNRFLVEGGFDHYRQMNGVESPADVKAT